MNYKVIAVKISTRQSMDKKMVEERRMIIVARKAFYEAMQGTPQNHLQILALQGEFDQLLSCARKGNEATKKLYSQLEQLGAGQDYAPMVFMKLAMKALWIAREANGDNGLLALETVMTEVKPILNEWLSELKGRDTALAELDSIQIPPVNFTQQQFMPICHTQRPGGIYAFQVTRQGEIGLNCNLQRDCEPWFGGLLLNICQVQVQSAPIAEQPAMRFVFAEMARVVKVQVQAQFNDYQRRVR